MEPGGQDRVDVVVVDAEDDDVGDAVDAADRPREWAEPCGCLLRERQRVQHPDGPVWQHVCQQRQKNRLTCNPHTAVI